MSAKTQSGGCRCGAIRFEFAGTPAFVAHCHCQSCRQASGCGFTTFVGCWAKDVTFTKGAPAIYQSSEAVERGYCVTCGSPIHFAGDKWSDQIHLFLGAFDDPDVFDPIGHSFPEERLHWAHLRDEPK